MAVNYGLTQDDAMTRVGHAPRMTLNHQHRDAMHAFIDHYRMTVPQLTMVCHCHSWRLYDGVRKLLGMSTY